MLIRNSIYKFFAIFFFWLPTSHTFALTCREFINSEPVDYQIKSSNNQYQLMWIGADEKALFDQLIKEWGLGARGPEIEKILKELLNEGKWVNCIYDEEAHKRKGNLSCGDKLFSTNNSGYPGYVFDKKGVRWRSIYRGNAEHKTKDCRIFDGGRTLINESYRIGIFEIKVVGQYYLIKEINTQEISVYYPEF